MKKSPFTGVNSNFLSDIDNSIKKKESDWDFRKSNQLNLDKCRAILLKQQTVKTVILSEKPNKIWQCRICNREFKYQYTLIRHMPIHTDVRNYRCNQCPKAFRQLSTLAQHKATHTNIRPYSCDQCKKSFNRISTLISHKKIHQNEKKYICHICGKGFHQKGNLRNHIYTHTNERPYKCDICEKGFNQKSNLVCHKSSAHGEKKIFKCEYCPVSFTRENTYASHLNMSHQGGFQPASVKSHFLCLSDNGTSRLALSSSNTSFLNPIIPIIPETSSSKVTGLLKFLACKNKEPDAKVKELRLQEEIMERGWSLIVRKKPTELMERLRSRGETVFVLLYEPGEKEPKICKATMGCDNFILTRPNPRELASVTYHHYLKVPVVMTVIRNYDENGNIYSRIIEYKDYKETVLHNMENSLDQRNNEECNSGNNEDKEGQYPASELSDSYLVIPFDEKGEVLTANAFFNVPNQQVSFSSKDKKIECEDQKETENDVRFQEKSELIFPSDFSTGASNSVVEERCSRRSEEPQFDSLPCPFEEISQFDNSWESFSSFLHDYQDD